MPLSQQLKQQIKHSIIRAIQVTGAMIYAKATEDTPVVTGTLKSSARFTTTSEGIKIAFDARYAAPVEFGIQKETRLRWPKKITWNPKIGPRSYGPPKTVVLTKVRPRPGQHFLGNAIQEILPDLVDEMANELKSVGEVTRR